MAKQDVDAGKLPNRRVGEDAQTVIAIRVPSTCRICDCEDAGKDGLCNVCRFLAVSIKSVERDREAKAFLLVVGGLVLLCVGLGLIFGIR